MGRSRASKDRARKADNAGKALALRIGGAGYKDIASALDCSVGSAWKWVNEELAKLDTLNAEQAERYRDLELHRLDLYIRSMNPKIRKGDARAITAALRVGERRAKLLGLDRPEVVEIITDRDKLKEELTKLTGAKPEKGAE